MKRKPGFLIGLFLAALVMSAPQLATGVQLGTIWYQSRSFPWRMLGLGSMNYGNTLSYAPMWRGRFIDCRFQSIDKNGKVCWKVMATDPQTGVSSDLGIELTGNNGFFPSVFGDRLFFFNNTNEYSELVDGKVKQFTSAGRVGVRWNSPFLINGEPASIDNLSVVTLKAAGWTTAGTIALPSGTIDGMLVDFRVRSSLEGISQGDRIHLFILYSNWLLYREGLQLDPGPTSPNQPASALNPANVSSCVDDWSMVRSKGVDPVLVGQRLLPPHGMLIAGMPAALIVDRQSNESVVGRIYRFDGKDWSESATQRFPFGSNQTHVVTTDDGQTSYLVVTTTTGMAHVYAVDANGIRATQGASTTNPSVSPILMSFQPMPAIPIIGLVTGTILGLIATLFFIAKADYGFGNRLARLSSLARRGLARLMDMILIGLVLAGLGWALTYGLDFLTLAEAINMKIEHPTIDTALTAASILVLALIVMVVTLVVVQGHWGLTPGKWCCGVRVLRTTLRPCGFARSLVREVVMCVDSCNLTCWTPGIISMALSEHRQRLGDLVADTVVVDIRTLKISDQKS